MTDNERWYETHARAFAAMLPKDGMRYTDASAWLVGKVAAMRRPNVIRFASAHGMIRIEERTAMVYPMERA